MRKCEGAPPVTAWRPFDATRGHAIDQHDLNDVARGQVRTDAPLRSRSPLPPRGVGTQADIDSDGTNMARCFLMTKAPCRGKGHACARGSFTELRPASGRPVDRYAMKNEYRGPNPAHEPGLNIADLVRDNADLQRRVRIERVPCTKPWTTLEEREDFFTRVPEDVTTCCWLRKHHGKARPDTGVMAFWNGSSARELRANMTRGVDEACPETCPILQDREGWFEKQELFTYSEDELATFSPSFLANRRTVLRAIVERREHVDALPLRLKVFPSNKCNLRCNMCPIDFEHAHVRTWYADRSFQEMLGYLEELLVFGAEPFFCDTSRRLLLEDPLFPQLHYSFITNGTLVTPRVVEALSRRRLGSVDVSLDACVKSTYEKIRIHGKFENAVTGARLLVELGRSHPVRKFKVYAGFAIQNLNYPELDSFIRFCAEMGLEANPAMAFPTKASRKRGELYGHDVAQLPQDVDALFDSLEAATDTARSLGQFHAVGQLSGLARELLRRMEACAPKDA